MHKYYRRNKKDSLNINEEPLKIFRGVYKEPENSVSYYYDEAGQRIKLEDGVKLFEKKRIGDYKEINVDTIIAKGKRLGVKHIDKIKKILTNKYRAEEMDDYCDEISY